MEIGGRMSKPRNGEKLTISEKFELVVQGGLQLIPFGIGASLSTIYYGAKQEKRFKRIENFYKDISQDIMILKEDEQKDIEDKLSSLNDNDQAALVAILEEINDKIEHEYTSYKINILKKYLINTLKDPVNEDNFDKRKYFLDVIGSMTLLECDNLGFIYNQETFVSVDKIKKEGVDRYEILGSINKLKSYGFLKAYQFYYATEEEKGAETGFGENIEISSLGRSFCDFCLTI